MKTEPLRSLSIVAALAVAAVLGSCGGPQAFEQPAAPSEPPALTEPASTAEGSGDTVVGVPTELEGRRCQPPAKPVPTLTEGPYFLAGSPERTTLIEAGTAGERLQLSGFVFDTHCTPLPGTKLDFWQADGNGAYDVAGPRLRGHQFTDVTGAYRLETVVPGQYSGRTEHIHVKVQPPGGASVTTQLFFPTAGGNQTDRIFDPALVIAMEGGNGLWIGAFDFIVEAPSQ